MAGSARIGEHRSAVTAVVFGLIAAVIGERGSRRGVGAIVGLVLGAITLAYWFGVIQGILRAT